MIGAAAVPSLLRLFNDPRSRLAEWDAHVMVDAPLPAILELLVPHAPDEVVRIALPLAVSESDEVRKNVGLHLASTGCVRVVPLLRQLMQDDDGYVRSYVAMGIGRAADAGEMDPEFRQQAYDLLLSQLDANWVGALNDAATYLIAVDLGRASRDLGDERWLDLANNNAHRIIAACNDAKLKLPAPLLWRLLNEALPRAVGERYYPLGYVVAAALTALTMLPGVDVRPTAEQLLGHHDDKIREAAAMAIAHLSAAPDPVRFVLGRIHHDGGYDSLTREQRVVYLAWLFDAEVCNGGLLQFFGNSSGDHASDTLLVLNDLAHKEAEHALAEAVQIVGPLAREPERELRLTAFEGRFDELRAAFDPLERAYYKTAAKLREAWLLYAADHPEHFRD